MRRARIWLHAIVAGLCIVCSVRGAASPYDIGFIEHFEDAELAVGWDEELLVDEIPTDPAQSYVMFVSPSWDGSTGLLMVQGQDAEAPELEFTMLCWTECTIHWTRMELSTPPDGVFGSLRMTFHYGSQIVEQVYEAPGIYDFATSDVPYLFGVKWSGTDVVIDDLLLAAFCGGVPNEAVTWGAIKSRYR